jgi:hypothetical protein
LLFFSTDSSSSWSSSEFETRKNSFSSNSEDVSAKIKKMRKKLGTEREKKYHLQV